MKYHSYDIFDTCLVRSCGSPLAVFDILAQRILGDDAENTCLMDFALERQEGEQRARKKYVSDINEEITIEEIYECCDFSTFTDVDKKAILNEELNVEKTVLFSVKTIRDEIDCFRNQGCCILFVSDMYLSYDFIKGVLENQKLYKEGDRLYLSSKIRQSKVSGNLFRYVLRDLHIKPTELLHSGDNMNADIRIPKKIGIKVKHVVHQMTEYELNMSNKQFGSQMMDVKVLASISSSIRLNLGERPEILMATDFIAPCMVSYVYWILEKAKKKGIKRLFFFARDAYLLYAIAQQFTNDFPEIELKYLYVSRSSLYLPGMKEISYDSIPSMFWDFSCVKAENILERFHIDDVDANSYNVSDDSREILETILYDSELVDRMKKKWVEQKELTIDYFRQEGLIDGNCAIVDLAGTRKCQMAVNNILEEFGYPMVYAYYFIVMRRRIKVMDYEALNFDERYNRNLLNSTLCPQDLFEQYFCITNQQRTNSYKRIDGRVEPQFETEGISDNYKKMVFETNQRVCVLFAKMYSVLLSKANHKYLAQVANSVFSYFYYVPNIKYITAFKGLTLSDSSLQTESFFSENGMLKAAIIPSKWKIANVMYNCPFPSLLFVLYKLDYKLLYKNGTYYSTINRIGFVMSRILVVMCYFKNLFRLQKQ